jgi:RNA polymerase sigma-70 factor (ECF subfamily)
MEQIFNKPTLRDEEIITKILYGEKALYELIIRRYNPLLYKIARNYGMNHQDAEDMMQDTYVTAYLELKNFRGDSSFKTWLTRIELNKCYHKVHYGAARFEANQSEFIQHNAEPMHTAKQDTEKTVLNKELSKVLEQSLQHLPLPYRNVFLLREIEGFSVAETAGLLDITEVNVKVRTARAKAMLQKYIEQYYSNLEVYEFNLVYCDKMVKNVFDKINALGG